jgi:FkbM family methyltransferase
MMAVGESPNLLHGRLPFLSVRDEALRALFWLAVGVLLMRSSTAALLGGCSPQQQQQLLLQPAVGAPTCTVAACAALSAASQPPRSVYFDIGANNGDSITEFVEGHPLPGDEKWDVVLIEATPRFTDQLLLLCASLVEEGKVRSCLPIVETALTTSNGVVSIFVEEGRREHDASTIVTDSMILRSAGSYFNATALDVVTLFTEVFPLTLQDSVYVKIDIEGAEFTIIPRAILHGLVPLWDHLDVEWHDQNPLIYGQLRDWYAGRHACLVSVLEVEGLRTGTWGR